MDASIFTDMLGNIAFPAVMCIYFMVKMNTTISELTAAVNELRAQMVGVRDEIIEVERELMRSE